MNLHEIKDGPRRNRWCGPSAMSAITGKLTDQTADVLRKVTGKRNITGTHHWTVLRGLKLMGYEAKQVTFPPVYKKKLTLAAWLAKTPRPEGKVFLVDAGNHWQVISGRRYVCGRIREIVSVRDKRVKRRARVQAAWEITKIVPQQERIAA